MRPRFDFSARLLAAALALAVVICGAPGVAIAAEPAGVDTTAATTPITPTDPKPAQPREYHAYYGGSFAFGYFDGDARFSIMPNVAWAFTPKVAAGIGASYEFVSYDAGEATANNFGGSVFVRYSFTPAIYGRTEYEARSLDAVTMPVGVGRETVEFFWLGGGVATPLGQKSMAYAEVLFDMVQDPLSPYEGGRPLTRLGVTFAF